LAGGASFFGGGGVWGGFVSFFFLGGGVVFIGGVLGGGGFWGWGGVGFLGGWVLVGGGFSSFWGAGGGGLGALPSSLLLPRTLCTLARFFGSAPPFKKDVSFFFHVRLYLTPSSIDMERLDRPVSSFYKGPPSPFRHAFGAGYLA